MEHKMHYMSDSFEIWIDVEADKTEAEIYEIIGYAAGTWEIDNDGTPGGSDFAPGEIIVYDLEEAGCRVIDYTEARI